MSFSLSLLVLLLFLFDFLCFAVAVTEGLVREEQLLHDLCLLGATTVEITQMLTRAELKITSEPLLRLEPGLVVWQSHFTI